MWYLSVDWASEDRGDQTGHAQCRDQSETWSTLASAHWRRTAAVYRRGGTTASTSPPAVSRLQVPATQEGPSSHCCRRPPISCWRAKDSCCCSSTSSVPFQRSTTAHNTEHVSTRFVFDCRQISFRDLHLSSLPSACLALDAVARDLSISVCMRPSSVLSSSPAGCFPTNPLGYYLSTSWAVNFYL